MPTSSSSSDRLSRRELLAAASIAAAWGVLPVGADSARADDSCPEEVQAPDPGLGWAPAQSLESWGHPFAQRIGVGRFYGGKYCEYTPNPGPHRGIDYSWGHGTPIYSVAAGVVEFAGRKSEQAWSWAGKYVVVRHGSGYRSLYAHMSALSVGTGATVSRHTKLGEVGETGLAQGNHLHLEIWSSGSRSSNVDPYRLVHAAPLAGSVGVDALPDTTDMEEEVPAVVYVAEGHSPVLAIGAKFWSISQTEAGSALTGGVPQVWLTKTSLEGLIADSRSSKTRGAAPLLIRVTGVGVIYVAHGGAVRLQNEDEVTNLKTKFDVREVRLGSQLADIIVNDLRNNTNG